MGAQPRLNAAAPPPGCPAGWRLRAPPPPGSRLSLALTLPTRGAPASSGQPRATPAGARGSSGEHAQSLPAPGGGGSATAGGGTGAAGAAAGRMEPPPPAAQARAAARARRGARAGPRPEEKAALASWPGRGPSAAAAPRGQVGWRGGGGGGGGEEPPREGKEAAGGVAPAPPPRPRPRRSSRSVTVDSSKARTSLEALKLSLRQLRWKEVGASGGAEAEERKGHGPLGSAFPGALGSSSAGGTGRGGRRSPGVEGRGRLCSDRTGSPSAQGLV